MSINAADKEALDRNFTRTTIIWGNITLFAGLLIATSAPFYLYFFANVDVTIGQIIAGFVAVAAIYGVFWIVEPIVYFPILGPAGMYQAFMIGNIANKLLPSAIVAQSTVKAVPGTRKGEFAATAAICGAAVVHVLCMLSLVGVLGSWVVTLVPDAVTTVAQLYILPSVLGGVLVQLIATTKNAKFTAISIVVALVVVLGIVPIAPSIVSGFPIGICVIVTIIIAWVASDRAAHASKD